MKIRTKLTLRYLLVSTLLVIFVFFALEETLFPQKGYDMLRILNVKLFAIWTISFIILFVIGYFMAGSALKPVSHIIRQVENITASNLSKRVEVEDIKDEIGELATTFNKTLDRLEKSFESQKMFISHVSHELRTPMAALIAELELSQHKERSNQAYKQVVTNALEDAHKIERLAAGLLDLAKASYHIDQINISEVRLDELLIDACNIITKANPKYKVDLAFDNESDDDDSMITVYGNEYLLRTAFVNLIENNCKFSDNHTSLIQISFSGTKVTITFSDNGIGIQPEDLQQLFTPFYRGSNRYYSPGNGIGLALAERIITLHQGEITVRSEPGKGTCFTTILTHI